jgi:type II secretory pathway pseudopilin PulG
MARSGLGSRSGSGALSRRRERTSGFTFVWVLLLIAVLGAGAAAGAKLWTTSARREKEAELLFVGDQYRRAIQSYYDRTPGSVKQLPPSLGDLLRDPRFPDPVRHLRRLYPDPITGKPDWGLVKMGDGIAAVHSLSRERPFKRGGFAAQYLAFAGATRYSDWVFGATVRADTDLAGTKTADTAPPAQGPGAAEASPFVPLAPAAPAAPAAPPKSPAAAPDRVQECLRQQVAEIDACRRDHAQERKELLACVARAAAQAAACRGGG